MSLFLPSNVDPLPPSSNINTWNDEENNLKSKNDSLKYHTELTNDPLK